MIPKRIIKSIVWQSYNSKIYFKVKHIWVKELFNEINCEVLYNTIWKKTKLITNCHVSWDTLYVDKSWDHIKEVNNQCYMIKRTINSCFIVKCTFKIYFTRSSVFLNKNAITGVWTQCFLLYYFFDAILCPIVGILNFYIFFLW